MLFPRFKLQLPDGFRRGEMANELDRLPSAQNTCECGCAVSLHSTANVRTVKRIRPTSDGFRVDVRWRRCHGVLFAGPGGVLHCPCPGFWKAS